MTNNIPMFRCDRCGIIVAYIALGEACPVCGGTFEKEKEEETGTSKLLALITRLDQMEKPIRHRVRKTLHGHVIDIGDPFKPAIELKTNASIELFVERFLT